MFDIAPADIRSRDLCIDCPSAGWEPSLPAQDARMDGPVATGAAAMDKYKMSLRRIAMEHVPNLK